MFTRLLSRRIGALIARSSSAFRKLFQPKKSSLVAVGRAILNPVGLGPTVLVRGKARTTVSRMSRHRAVGFNCSLLTLCDSESRLRP